MKLQKELVLQDIVRTMAEHNITIGDVDNAQKEYKRAQFAEKETFDLLVDISGERKRVSFEEGRTENFVAIYPFKDSDVYLELDETGETEYPPLENQNRLAHVDFIGAVMSVRPELNEKLRQLGKPILSGRYWVKGYEHPGHAGYWEVQVRQDKMDTGYGNPGVRAKVRYVGRL